MLIVAYHSNFEEILASYGIQSVQRQIKMKVYIFLIHKLFFNHFKYKNKINWFPIHVCYINCDYGIKFREKTRSRT